MPHAFDACFNSSPAVPGDDQRGIMAVLGLTDAVPATYPLGETLVGHWTGWPDQVQVRGHPLIARTDAGRHPSTLRDCHMMRV